MPNVRLFRGQRSAIIPLIDRVTMVAQDRLAGSGHRLIAHAQRWGTVRGYRASWQGEERMALRIDLPAVPVRRPEGVVTHFRV
jgi:hypothetical protein